MECLSNRRRRPTLKSQSTLTDIVGRLHSGSQKRISKDCSTSCGLEVAYGRTVGKAKRRCCYGLDERGMVGRRTMIHHFWAQRVRLYAFWTEASAVDEDAELSLVVGLYLPPERVSSNVHYRSAIEWHNQSKDNIHLATKPKKRTRLGSCNVESTIMSMTCTLQLSNCRPYWIEIKQCMATHQSLWE